MKAAYVRSVGTGTEVGRFLGVMTALVRRDIRGRYRRSLLGPVWAVLQPLLYMLIFTFIRSFVSIDVGPTPYAVFTFAALVPWTFFANSVSWCAPSVQLNKGIVKKIALPREVFPAAAVVTSLVDFAIASVVLAGLMIYFGVPVGANLLWVFPLLLMTFLFALGIGFITAALGTYKRDVMFGIPFIMQFWMLATPIMYPASKVPGKWRFAFDLNPMVGIIEGFRSAVALNAAPDFNLLLISLIGIAAVWAVGLPLFRYMSQYFADVL